MTKTEGVVKYHLDFTRAGIDPAGIEEINAWRKIMYRLGLIGRDPDRYGGFGYGNISTRLVDEVPQPVFVISGTQTGHLAALGPEHYAIVASCDPQQNTIVARGPIKPSSEALTHHSVYLSDASVGCVIHAHCPEIWRAAQALDIPATPESAAYGTPEMATEIERLFTDTDVHQKGLLAMGGHTDGVVACGRTPREAGTAMIACLARALQIAAR